MKTTLFKKIDSFRNLNKGWNSYDADISADIPNDRAIKYTKNIISIILAYNNKYEISVIPDVEGGIYIEIENEDDYLIINIYNEGNFVCIIDSKTGKDEPKMLIEIEPMKVLEVLGPIINKFMR